MAPPSRPNELRTLRRRITAGEYYACTEAFVRQSGGGYITGRPVELVPNERIVQVWRAGGWPAGDYSIAKFELVEQGSETKIVFDHKGFPNGKAEALASGWKAHYGEPLTKLRLDIRWAACRAN